MFNVNLTKEIHKETKAKTSGSEETVKEVKLLLEAQETLNKNILKASGLDFHLKLAEEQLEISIKQEEFVKKHGGDSPVPVEVIKDLCVRYGLRFLHTKYYKGTIDTQVSFKLLALLRRIMNIEDTTADIPHYAMKSALEENLYILAPTDSFTLVNTETRAQRLKRLREEDPILFYQIPGTSTYYLVHSWGKDLSIVNWLKAFVYRSFYHELSVRLLLSVVKAIIVGILFAHVIAFIVALAISTFFAFHNTITNEDNSTRDSCVVYNTNSWDQTKRYDYSGVWRTISWIL